MPTENLCTPSLDSCSNQATTTLFQIADSEIQAGVAPQPYPEPDHEVTKQVYIYYFFNERHK